MLYQSDDLARIDAAQFAADLTRHLADAFASHPVPIALELRTSPVHLNTDTAVPLGLILNELVSNAYRHAFPDDGTRTSGQVRVELDAAGPGAYRLVVADDGVGLPPEKSAEPPATSLGLRLVHSFVEQLGGTLQHDRPAVGTQFTVWFREINELKRAA